MYLQIFESLYQVLKDSWYLELIYHSPKISVLDTSLREIKDESYLTAIILTRVVMNVLSCKTCENTWNTSLEMVGNYHSL